MVNYYLSYQKNYISHWPVQQPQDSLCAGHGFEMWSLSCVWTVQIFSHCRNCSGVTAQCNKQRVTVSQYTETSLQVNSVLMWLSGRPMTQLLFSLLGWVNAALFLRSLSPLLSSTGIPVFHVRSWIISAAHKLVMFDWHVTNDAARYLSADIMWMNWVSFTHRCNNVEG